MMEPLLPVAVGLGLAVSLLFSEVFGLVAGGMVVPGYLALHLSQPLDIALTMLAGVLTYFLVHALGQTIVIYGRRRTVVMILVGYGVGIALSSFFYPLVQQTMAHHPGQAWFASELHTIGYIIPGLLAIWIDRQGVWETTSVSLTASVVVRLLLILLLGREWHV